MLHLVVEIIAARRMQNINLTCTLSCYNIILYGSDNLHNGYGDYPLKGYAQMATAYNWFGTIKQFVSVP